jgi:hypothetical protein
MTDWKEFFDARQDKLQEEAVRLAVFGSLDRFVGSVLDQSFFQPQRKRRGIMAHAVCCSAGTVYDPREDGSLYEYFKWFAETANRLMINECKSRRWYVMGSVDRFFVLIKDTIELCDGDYERAAAELHIRCNEAAMKKAVGYPEHIEEQKRRRQACLEGGLI